MLLILLAVSTAALPGPEAGIRAYHEAYRKALIEKPPQVAELLKQTLTPDFSLVTSTGKRLGKVQVMAQEAERTAKQKTTRFAFRMGTPRRNADGIQVMVRDDWEFVSKGSDGKPVKKAFTRITSETWVLVGKAPKCQLVREIAAATPIQPGQAIGGPKMNARPLRMRIGVGRNVRPEK